MSATTATAIGAVFDYMLAEMVDRVATVDDRGLVVDTYTDVYPTDGSPLFCVGASFPSSGEAGEGTRAYVQLGRQGVEEDFGVPCYAAAGSAAGDQKIVRDVCLKVYDQACALVAADVTLDGILHGGEWAEIGPVSMTATTITANKGTSRWCVVSFSIHCKNHYYPAE